MVRWGHGIAKVMIGAYHNAGFPADFNHFSRVREMESQRFFAQGMLPGFRGRQDFSFVPIIGGTDVDHVNRRICQQIVNRRVGPRNSVLRCISPCPFRARTHYGRYRAIGLRINRFEHPGLGNVAGANESPT
jgi:hypothetical protein